MNFTYLEAIKKITPKFASKITHYTDCHYNVTHDEKGIFSKRNNVVYATGLNGRGFKFMPIYGKFV